MEKKNWEPRENSDDATKVTMSTDSSETTEDVTASSTNSENNSRSSQSKILIVAIVAVLVIIAVIAFLLIGRRTKSIPAVESDSVSEEVSLVEESTDSVKSSIEESESIDLQSSTEIESVTVDELVEREEPIFYDMDISDPSILDSLTVSQVFGDRDWINSFEHREVGIGSEEKVFPMEVDIEGGSEVYLYFIGVPSLSEASNSEFVVKIEREEFTFTLDGKQAYQKFTLPATSTGKLFVTLYCKTDGDMANILFAVGQK